MEQSAAATLAEELEKAPLPLIEVIRRALAIAGAVNQLHRAGRVHGRLEPAVIVADSVGRATCREPGRGRLDSPLIQPRSSSTAKAIRAATSSRLARSFTKWRRAGRPSLATPGKPYARQFSRSQPTPIASVLPHATSPAYTALDRLIAGCLVKNPDQRRQRMQNVLVDLKLMAVLVARATPRSAPPASANPQPMPPLAISLRPPDPTAEIPLADGFSRRGGSLRPSARSRRAGDGKPGRQRTRVGGAADGDDSQFGRLRYGTGFQIQPAAKKSAFSRSLKPLRRSSETRLAFTPRIPGVGIASGRSPLPW